MTEPRDIEKDKGILELYADIRPISQIEEIASYYISLYEAAQARIAELEKYNARLLAAVPDEVLDELKALEGVHHEDQRNG